MTAPAAPVTPDVSYSDCNDVRAAGAAPLMQDQPGYRTGLDPDGDGIACDMEG